ncbi:hypothetical protein A5791_04130 [Mycobacterium sp. 852002-51163_SCH5372311]|uniref:FUSC family protein n=1 Tax=Mycobacterium sp. 852002-51163_SCH5372311 TaxID=1834097 RepID=UPI0007FF6794|nr:FUSC family protein [Mycobacterium sp. 852002-51163_SCH5372311]OBF82633.1 hypothetical protein A5791_04130 [Mycobacterium sp. 852002-51163_SCH5372311]
MFTGAAARRLRRGLWPIAQTTIAASLAWYLAHDVLGHKEPFFAPISAAVCLWMTNLVRAELAVEMIIGVTVGIGVGTAVLAVLGTGTLGMGAAVLFSLTLAVFIAQSFATQRTMFVNQSVISAILIMAFPHTGLGVERLYDALIGGGLAVVFSILLFPKNPLAVLHDARGDVLTAVEDILGKVVGRNSNSSSPDQSWTPSAADRLHRQLARLVEARGTARQLAYVCPRRWPMRKAVRVADHQASHIALFGSSVLQLARTLNCVAEPLAESLRAATSELADAAAALAADEPEIAAAHADSVRHRVAALRPPTPAGDDVLPAAVIGACADELEQVVHPEAP